MSCSCGSPLSRILSRVLDFMVGGCRSIFDSSNRKRPRSSVMARCGAVWCGAVWCGVVRCGAVWCGAVRCGAVWCGAALRFLRWTKLRGAPTPRPRLLKRFKRISGWQLQGSKFGSRSRRHPAARLLKRFKRISGWQLQGSKFGSRSRRHPAARLLKRFKRISGWQ